MLGKFTRLLRRTPRRPIRMLQIEPSLECNLECVMCPWSEMRPGQGIMTWQTFASVAPHLGMAQEVDLTGGGEPVTNDRLADMAAAAKAAGCRAGFSTNGILLEQALTAELLAAGLDWISFSVDAAQPETYERIRRRGDFGVLDANIMGLAEMKARASSRLPQVMLVFVMMRENYAELPAYIDLARRWGAGRVIVKNLDVIVKEGDDERRVVFENGLTEHAVHEGAPRPAGRSRGGRRCTKDGDALEALAEAGRRAKRYGIGLRRYAMQPAELAVCEPDPLHGLFVNWQGDVSPCITLAYASSRVFEGVRHSEPCLRFGNVAQAPLPQIWDSPDYRAFRQRFAARLSWQGQAAVEAVLPGGPESGPIPPAPEPCRTCYYLYGV